MALTGNGWELECEVVNPNDLKKQLDELKAEMSRIREELALWRPLTPQEAEQAFNEAEATPLSKEQIVEMVKRAMDPAERLNNSEQARLAVRVKKLEAEKAFLAEKGITVGLMKTSDKPEPYLAYVIQSGSELDDLPLVNRLTDLEIRNRKLEDELNRLKGTNTPQPQTGEHDVSGNH